MKQLSLLIIGYLCQLSDLFLPSPKDVQPIDHISEVYVWGCGGNGKLGSLLGNGRIESPTLNPNFTAHNPKLILPGSSMTAILADDGSMYSCGKGEYGRLGIGPLTETRELIQLPFNGVSIIQVSVSSGSYGHGLAVDENRCVWSWGDGDYGKLGHGNTDQCPRPKQLTFFQNIPAQKLLVVQNILLL